MEEYITKNEGETEALGKAFAENLKAGDIVALTGDLGCGKTAFVRGVMSRLGNPDDVTSPTFTIVNEYDGSLPVYHFDVYRLENPNPESLDFMDDYFFGEGVCLIEWADNILPVLPDNTTYISFSKISENQRQITIK